MCSSKPEIQRFKTQENNYAKYSKLHFYTIIVEIKYAPCLFSDFIFSQSALCEKLSIRLELSNNCLGC